MKLWIRLALFAAGATLAACSFDSPGANGNADANPTVDAEPDGDTACPGERLGFAPSNFAVCDIPEPAEALVIPELSADPSQPEPDKVWNFNTDTGLMRLNDQSETLEIPGQAVGQLGGGPEVFMISVESFRLEGRVRAYGSRPLVIVAFTDVVIATRARLFATFVANRGVGPGAGLDAFCNGSGTGADGIPQLSVLTTAGTGGGGGGFGGKGGGGAAIDFVQDGVAGGAATGNAEITPLRGGCDGGRGGAPASSGGSAGGGGGAIQIVAKDRVVVEPNGIVTAFGFGGRGTNTLNGGGGGGGSGGAILLEAGLLSINGALTANGGGGGEGHSGAIAGRNGISGSANTLIPAPGGDSGPGLAGGNGGNGAAAEIPARDGSPPTLPAGAGGGGGGPGRIRLNALTLETAAATLSPAATTGSLGQ